MEIVTSKPLPQLPNTVWSAIIQQHILSTTLSESLLLRQINAWFNDEVLCTLFVLQIRDLRNYTRYRIIPRHISILQLQGFFAKRKVPVKAHKIVRKSVLRALDFDPNDPAIATTCFYFQQGHVCPSKLVGSSSSSSCSLHDMLNAMASAFGSLVFALGSDYEESEISSSRDKRFWLLLIACYNSDITRVKYFVQELLSDDSVEREVLANMLCDCFLIAVRENKPLLIDVLHEEMGECEELPSKLGKRSSAASPLIEAIRFGHHEVFEKLLKWQWKFNNSNWSYIRILKAIINCDEFRKRDNATTEKFLRIMFEWTDTWRNISEMKEYLIRVGENNQQRFLEVAIEALKSQIFYRHERGQEGSFSPSQPLQSLTQHGNLAMVNLYLDNRAILLPHTDAAKDKEMRLAVLRREFERYSEARVDLIKAIIGRSQDLLDSKTELQIILAHQYESKLETWGWLAKKVGLDSIYQPLPQHTLGSVILEPAVEKLNVETVRFLVNNGVQLVAEARALQVYEDDNEMMTKLKTIKTLLEKGGQGEFKERRVLETTFTPLKTVNLRAKRASVALKSNPSTELTTANAAAKASYSTSYPRFLRKSLSIATKKHNTKKTKKGEEEAEDRLSA